MRLLYISLIKNDILSRGIVTKVRLVIPIAIIIIALIFSGCIHRSKDIPLNRPDDLARIPYEDTPAFI